jgi:hypothetical protein
MTAENAHPEDKRSPPERSGRSLGKAIWVWPPLLTAALAAGVSIWGGGFGAVAIGGLAAWIVWAIAREASPNRGRVWAVAWGVAAGVVLMLLCTQQSALIFGSPTAASTATATPTGSASEVICAAEVLQNLTEDSSVAVTGSIMGLPDGAQVTTVATSAGRTLATVDSYPDGKGVAAVSVSVTPSPGETVQIRAEVRVGAEVMQTCLW